MSRNTEPDKGDNPNYLTGEYQKPMFRSNLSHRGDVTEEILTGEEDLDYRELLDSLEQEYGLEELSEYEDPENVRISYHITGDEFEWDYTLQIEIDVKEKKFDWIPEFIEPVKNRFAEYPLQDKNKFFHKILTEKRTYTHTIEDTDDGEIRELMSNLE